MIGNTKLKRTLVTASAVALAAAGPLAACGSDDEAADDTTTTTTAADAGAESAVTIEDVWVRPGTAGGNSAVYMTLTGGDTDDALVGVTVSADVVEAAEVHETVAAEGGADMGEGDMADDTMPGDAMTDETMPGEGDMGDDDSPGGGMMTMQEVDSIAIPAGGTIALEPGGYHIMLLGLTEDLVVGDTIEVTLNFESGATETVTAEVQEA